MSEPDTPGQPTPELTPVQYALLDDVREVAMCAHAPAAQYAGRALVRLLCLELGHPVPQPVEREGGLAGLLYGNPVTPELPRRPPLPPRPIRDQPQA